MFLLNVPHITWTRTDTGRGKRSTRVACGVYVIEHIATGKLLVGCSKKTSDAVDLIIDRLRRRTYDNRAFSIIHDMDYDLKLYEASAKSLGVASNLERLVRLSVDPQYLLLN